jgi:hypothetical protein
VPVARVFVTAVLVFSACGVVLGGLVVLLYFVHPFLMAIVGSFVVGRVFVVLWVLSVARRFNDLTFLEFVDYETASFE